MVKPIPEGYHAVTPFMHVADGNKLIEFAKKAFGAEQLYAMASPDGNIRHAEIRIGDSRIMIGGGGQTKASTLYLYVTDCDAAYKKAIAAGGKSVREPKTEFYGDRSGGVEDSQGNQWWVATHVEDVSPEELEKRAKTNPQAPQ